MGSPSCPTTFRPLHRPRIRRVAAPVSSSRSTSKTRCAESYLDYSMSVIVGRALPDVRDGLKPVHRRILFAMHDAGQLHNRPYKKCAARRRRRASKKYHPHGDAAVYDALVRLAQPWNLRYLLVDGQGNFGSVDGDSRRGLCATPKCRMDRLAEELLADIDKETVDFGPNYDDSHHGAAGPARAVPEPPGQRRSRHRGGHGHQHPAAQHGRGDRRARIHLIDNPKATVAELMKFIPGPDFPTARLHPRARGHPPRLRDRPRADHPARAARDRESTKKTERETIVVTEIPYQVNKARLIEQIAELVREKKLEGISDIRDESRPRRACASSSSSSATPSPGWCSTTCSPMTPLQTTFGIVLLAIDGGQPRTLNLKEMLERFIAHRREVVTRRSRFELRKAEARLHIVEGLLVAQDIIDHVITIIRTLEGSGRGAVGPDARALARRCTSTSASRTCRGSTWQRPGRRWTRWSPAPGRRSPSYAGCRTRYEGGGLQRGAGEEHPRHAAAAAHRHRSARSCSRSCIELHPRDRPAARTSSATSRRCST